MCVHLEAHQFETRLDFTPYIKFLSTQVLTHHQSLCDRDCSTVSVEHCPYIESQNFIEVQY